ncbi:uncharacterized protein C8Q71DRAFT_717841 [Rhodofomes roseus]|uniref:Uncharacterized protein n=1 Tax=Rhodofomes roseus TaxID=34475 RepID=A0ABQ8JZW4_9APHY|nr:uncharacterized protein C8Q71DRAFT_717841 [Rhodofomes roseus]KAH9829632.1 hypothetical protein C8Q71DRAFT_717841 [Rhodofomes roseus]
MRRHRNRYGQVACLTILALLSTPGSCQTTGYRTIDDYYGDSVTGQKPVYSEGWNYGPTCSDCLVRPYAAYTFEGSWHDVTASPTDTSPRNVTLTFNAGTAIWVYCIIPNYIPYATTLVDLSFQLDGLGLATYYDVPNPNDTYWYNATVFSRTGLSNEVHTLVMVVNGERSASYAAFDWAEYSSVISLMSLSQ